jgi:hypothetical protein
MELKPCPVCGCKPLLLSETEVVCINGECSVNGVVAQKKIWNLRADVVSRDRQILKELELEHSMKLNMDRIKSRFPEISE